MFGFLVAKTIIWFTLYLGLIRSHVVNKEKKKKRESKKKKYPDAKNAFKMNSFSFPFLIGVIVEVMLVLYTLVHFKI